MVIRRELLVSATIVGIFVGVSASQRERYQQWPSKDVIVRNAKRGPRSVALVVPKRNPHERRPRAPDWEPDKVGAEIAELAAASDDAAGGDIAA